LDWFCEKGWFCQSAPAAHRIGRSGVRLSYALRQLLQLGPPSFFFFLFFLCYRLFLVFLSLWLGSFFFLFFRTLGLFPFPLFFLCFGSVLLLCSPPFSSTLFFFLFFLSFFSLRPRLFFFSFFCFFSLFSSSLFVFLCPPHFLFTHVVSFFLLFSVRWPCRLGGQILMILRGLSSFARSSGFICDARSCPRFFAPASAVSLLIAVLGQQRGMRSMVCERVPTLPMRSIAWVFCKKLIQECCWCGAFLNVDSANHFWVLLRLDRGDSWRAAPHRVLGWCLPCLFTLCSFSSSFFLIFSISSLLSFLYLCSVLFFCPSPLRAFFPVLFLRLCSRFCSVVRQVFTSDGERPLDRCGERDLFPPSYADLVSSDDDLTLECAAWSC